MIILIKGNDIVDGGIGNEDTDNYNISYNISSVPADGRVDKT